MAVAIEIPHECASVATKFCDWRSFYKIWGFRGGGLSGSWPRIVCYVGTNVSEEHTASIFMEPGYISDNNISRDWCLCVDTRWVIERFARALLQTFT
jgi:hypothetical protein